MFDLRPLGFPTFRRLAGAYAINELGTWFGDIALALLVFGRTSSPLATAGLFLVLRCFPSLLAPFLTTWVEARPPRVALPALYCCEALLYGALAVVASHFTLGLVLVLAAADGVFAITAKAMARSATANELEREGMLREGNALLNLAFMGSSAAGPALAGIIVAWRGASAALAVDAVSFAVTAVALATLSNLRLEIDHAAGTLGRLRAGLRVIKSGAALRWLLIAFAVSLTLASIAVPVEVVFVRVTLHTGDSGYGALLGAWGVGMIIGGAVFALAKGLTNGPLLASSMILIAIGYGGLAASPTLFVACVFSAIGGIGNGIGGVTAVTAIQRAIPITAQSAVMSVFEGLNQVMPALGFILGGALTAVWNPRIAYAVSAIGVALVVGVGVTAVRLRSHPTTATAGLDQ